MAETWDESKPAGSRSPTLGDDDIREFKRAVRERLAEDHDFEAAESPAFGGASSTIGKHKYVTLVQRNTSKTTASDEVAMVCKAVSGNPELILTPPSAGTDRQLTKNSGANLNLNSGDFASRIIPANALNTASVDQAAISNFAVGASQLNTGSVSLAKMGSYAVGTSQLVTGAVGSDQVAGGAVTAGKLGAGVPILNHFATSDWDPARNTSYTSIAWFYFRFRTGMTTLRLRAEIKVNDSIGYIRMTVGGLYSAGAATSSTAYATKDGGSINVSGFSDNNLYSGAIQTKINNVSWRIYIRKLLVELE
jgi:hypothetical protein